MPVVDATVVTGMCVLINHKICQRRASWTFLQLR